MMKKKASVAVLSVIMAASLAACSSGTGSQSGSGSSSVESASTAESTGASSEDTSAEASSAEVSGDDGTAEGAADAATEAGTESVADAADDAGTESTAAAEDSQEDGTLEDGVYSAKFETDNSMFQVNEANNGLGVLTVKDGQMTIHVSLASERIVHLFAGTAADAQKDGAQLLDPTVDEVTYSDGTTEEVYGFDIPVPALDEEFAVALVGTKGNWYDHKVKVTDAQPITQDEADKLANIKEGAADSGDDSAADGDTKDADKTRDSDAKTGNGRDSGKKSTASAKDQAAADQVADLIDAIYVQERTDKTDAQCRAAKEAWDALTDAQRELVSGENADPDYFGRDTGDASLDNPLNQDDIGENELLVVSFGTSFNSSRAKDISAVERALQEAYPDWSVRRAFTAQIIINHVEARNSEYIDNMDQALQRAVDNKVKNLVVQPTHLMHGAEYDELAAAVEKYKDHFDSVKVAEPLLGEVGRNTSDVNDDKETVAKAVTAAAVDEAGYKSLQEAAEDGTAFVLMGHGTSHEANITYDQMQSEMENLGYENVFVGTVEGKPADTACQAVIRKVHDAGYKKVVLRPLMVVAGDHANNDMAGDDEDSWKSQFTDSGYFDEIDCQIEGMGRIPEIEDIYISHASDAIGEEPAAWKARGADSDKADSDAEGTSVADLSDGRYVLPVTLEGGSGRASVLSPSVVTIKDGKADAVVIWSSDKYDYMIVDGEKYLNESAAGNSSFTIPVETLNAPIEVTADTTAMSRPHEIEYTLTFELEQ